MQLVRYPLYLFGKIGALAFIFVGGGLLAVLVFPILRIYPGRQQERAQKLIHVTFRFYIRAIQFVNLIHLEVEDSAKFAQCGGKMIIANHPSLLDVVILMSLVPRAQCIVKHELWRHPFLGVLVRRAGYIRNDLEPEELIKACNLSLEEGRCLIIFPEGTRTTPGSSPTFHRGFANIATLTKAPIQSVLITCDPPFLFKVEPWWHVPSKRPFFRVSIGEHLDASKYSLYSQRSLNARKLVKSLELYYAVQLGNRET